MKSSLAVLALLASFSLSAHDYNYGDYQKIETKLLDLSSENLSSFAIDAGAGSLTVIGNNSNLIEVSADIFQKEAGESYCLSLDTKGSSKSVALLRANTCHSNNGTRIDLTVSLPESLMTKITDGSGSIHVSNSSVEYINDGSGSINVEDNKVSLTVKDGSGSMHITNLAGDVSINDGSGSITLNTISGHVEVDDGSGSINVNNAKSFKLNSDGSGGVELSNVTQTY